MLTTKLDICRPPKGPLSSTKLSETEASPPHSLSITTCVSGRRPTPNHYTSPCVSESLGGVLNHNQLYMPPQNLETPPFRFKGLGRQAARNSAQKHLGMTASRAHVLCAPLVDAKHTVGEAPLFRMHDQPSGANSALPFATSSRCG